MPWLSSLRPHPQALCIALPKILCDYVIVTANLREQLDLLVELIMVQHDKLEVGLTLDCCRPHRTRKKQGKLAKPVASAQPANLAFLSQNCHFTTDNPEHLMGSLILCHDLVTSASTLRAADLAQGCEEALLGVF